MGTVAGVASLVSHDFYEGQLTGLSPDPEWIKVDVNGDTTVTFPGEGTSNAYIQLAFPSTAAPGHQYDASATSGVFEGCAFVQDVTQGVDFQIEMMCPSDPAELGHAYGLIVFNPGKTEWITFNTYRTGSGIAYEGSHQGPGTANSWWFDSGPQTLTHPYGMRLGHITSGYDWTFQHNINGAGWISANSNYTTDTEMSGGIGSAGFFTANFGPWYNAHTRSFDWFFEATHPVTPEDTFDSFPSGTRRIFIIS